MSIPQPGVLAESSAAGLFITLTASSDPESLSQVRAGCHALPHMTAEISIQHEDDDLVSVIGIGSDYWDHLFPGGRPAQLHSFIPLEDDRRHAPATQTDLFLHIRSARADLNFLLAKQVMEKFGSAVKVVEEVKGFRFMDSRDLTGFVDGTENPKGDERIQVGLVGEEDAVFAGGSYIHIQRYVHNLPAWEALEEEKQVSIIGRTKIDDLELEGAAKLPTAHISRVDIKVNGPEGSTGLKILRHSMPYGSTAAAGLFFIAYGRSPEPFERMLERMILADDQGHYDHLMGYSHAVTGGAFFAPPLEFLQALG